ncbi:hypothetical protein Q5752_003436 [Cryptotrichosporon argae]
MAVTTTTQYVLGPGGTPFYTKEWMPSSPARAHVLFVHGFAEHIERYDGYFPLLAAHGLHVTAYDQRGDGRTSIVPLKPDADEVRQWRAEGRAVVLEGKKSKRRNGGWKVALADMEWWIRREKERAGAKKLFLMGHSMGGGQAIAFVTRSTPPPSLEVVNMLAGVITMSPLIRLTNPTSWIQLKAGTLAAGLGLGSMLIPTPLKTDHFSHNAETNAAAASDPLCEQVGSVRQMADMLNGGASLDAPAVHDAWPTKLPLLVVHGADDQITCCETSKRFVDGAKAEDKTHYAVPGMYHELYNEPAPVPADVAKYIADWMLARAEDGPVSPGVAKL